MKESTTEGINTTSASRKDPRKKTMKKLPIRTTKYGTQSVSVMDIIESEDGWAEIERLRDAALVRNPSSANGTGSGNSASESSLT